MFDRCQHQRRNHRKAKGHRDYREGINHLWPLAPALARELEEEWVRLGVFQRWPW